MMSARSTPTLAEQHSRALALACAGGLLALGCLWAAPAASPAALLWALIKSLPLLPALLGLWRYRLYTYRWVSLLAWAYVTEGLVHASSSGGADRAFGIAEAALALTLFGAVSWHIRLRLGAAKAA